MSAIRSLHLPSSSIGSLPEHTIECLSFPCLFPKFATQPLEKRHLRNREPYVRYLVQIYRMMVSERLFGSVDPLPQKRHQSLSLH